MDNRLTWFRTPFLFVAIMSALAAGCAPSSRYEPIVRKPVPTLSEPLSPSRMPLAKGMIAVADGDSLYKLARRHGVPLRGLIEANRLSPPYVIYPGQHLRLPRSSHHRVRDGETVYTIARKYNVDMGAVVRINRIPPPYRIEKGQRLRLPDGKTANTAPKRVVVAVKPDPRPAQTTRRITEKPKIQPPSPPRRAASNRQETGPLRTPPKRSGRKFLWPLKGRVIVSYGARKGGKHNDGINIAARKGAAIKAAENGVVAYAGNQLQGFGNLVLIKHSDGWMSAYAHSSVLLVKRGDIVRRGQVIARVGRTGSVSRPQLHFELRKGEHAVNPKRYLVRLAGQMGPHHSISVAFRDARRGPG